MKKIALSIMTVGAMFFGTQNLQAQVETEVEVETELEAEVEQDAYASVEVVSLPQAVKVAVMKEYTGAVVTEAWMKSDEDEKIYKLKLDVDGEIVKVFIDAEGKWVEDEEMEETDK
ncbi:hypothetical protein [Christiangramia salexigens]|uniref:PepSY domain-containing protein n=1 Tax=Christiangramia salexigens TaxID=1913577 RepID=A0A1L3J772_9FLAO|nr:hypothetical protein [Christiangramia salexigens]APG60986.1 hypothetical protein LPB144_11450 [Christiangramia salexigens]